MISLVPAAREGLAEEHAGHQDISKVIVVHIKSRSLTQSVDRLFFTGLSIVKAPQVSLQILLCINSNLTK